MKNLFRILFLLLVSVILVGCNNDDETNGYGNGGYSNGNYSNSDDNGDAIVGTYYNVGDVINLWDTFEIVIHGNTQFFNDFPVSPGLNVRYERRATDKLIERNWATYENGVVLIPATMTNLTESSSRYGLRHNLYITGPNGKDSNARVGSWGIFAHYMGLQHGLNDHKTFTTPIEPGEVRNGYIIAHYDGDGYYIIRFTPLRQGNLSHDETRTVIVRFNR